MKYIDDVLGEITEKQYNYACKKYETANAKYCYGAKPLNDILIIELKQQLADTDYKAIKHSEGLISDEQYEPIKQQREQWRIQIRELEKGVNNE